jgi:galactitol-specific phosphotransferase system IIB component
MDMIQLKNQIKEKLNEANLKSNISGTSLNKLPKKIKSILINDLRLSTHHLNQIFFDKHLKQIMIVTKPIVLSRSILESLMSAPEFLYIQYSQDIDMTGLTIAFSYNGSITKKKNQKDEVIFDDVEDESDTFGLEI